jgi:hypothetical protein
LKSLKCKKNSVLQQNMNLGEMDYPKNVLLP